MAFVMRFAADDVHQVVIADSGHWLMEEQPHATIAAIRAFLSSGAPLAQARHTLAQVDALPREGAGAGTIRAEGDIQTTVLAGNPSLPGPYAIEIRVPAHTRIAAHRHRDNRTAHWSMLKANGILDTVSGPMRPHPRRLGRAGSTRNRQISRTSPSPAICRPSSTSPVRGPTDTTYVIPTPTRLRTNRGNS